MRLATRALRQIQPQRSVPHPRCSLSLPSFQRHADETRHSVVRADRGTRVFSVSSPRSSVADYDLIRPEILSFSHAPARIIVASRPSQTPLSSSLIQETKAFRKWSALLADPNRLAVETDFFRQGPAKQWRSPLLVDKFENSGDLALWACLLDYQMRINGPAGVVHVWKALWGRKTLFDVDSPLAQMFWRVMLDGALMSDDSSILEGVWVYSEWMYHLHRVKWPHLYTTVMKHLLRTHQHQRALQWQLRLIPNFYPGLDEFTNLIKEFVLDKELYRMDTLLALYKTSPEKKLYTTLLPYLFNLGESQLARKWRRIFIIHGEEPSLLAPVRPFLRFLQGYYPNDKFTRKEHAALKFTPAVAKDEQSDLSREFMNLVHGRTFGITAKDYNDRLGAKWFASSWVSLDVAISTVSAIGVEKIGPLSLQSIALRAGNAEGLLNRIAQLREHGISVVESNYFRLIFYLAKQNDNEVLDDLVRSDLHPEVFDDLNLQTRLIDSAADTSDWQTLRLLLISRLVAFEQSARSVANDVLRLRFERRSQDGVLQILEHMKARNIVLNFEEASHIYDSLIEDYKHGQKRLDSQPSVFYLSIFRQLKSMDVPVPVSLWKLIMLSMARRGQIEDLARLSVEVVDMFLTSMSFRPGLIPVHIWDLPEAIRYPLGGVENLLGVYIPQDIPTNHHNHPLHELFDSKGLTEMIENAFLAHPGQGFQPRSGAESHRRLSQGSQITKAIRLLRAVNDRGMWLHYRKIRFVVTNCFVNIYGPSTPVDTRQRLMRASNTLRLDEMKTLVDHAWGGKLLPPIEDLIRIVRKRPLGATLRSRKPAEPMEYESGMDD
ncbi:hypothetical protein F5B22DRAFT_185125 [Xylaria bambusicola]|uniref:uncharacterized protein n=1 Tax=Xylaria bambusicola TaxID=326684 RepID=UPI002007F5EA|nr:uncharacterized protein F5B22DRAFT_185125 [Xylaria bambusicola]KAI0515360.1 hypothetical protein F5B22DRAFT_185125 [Xylaria bambusicola]